MKGSRFGLVGDIAFGIVGVSVARFLLPAFGSGIIAMVVNASIGACILIFLFRMMKRAIS